MSTEELGKPEGTAQPPSPAELSQPEMEPASPVGVSAAGDEVMQHLVDTATDAGNQVQDAVASTKDLLAESRALADDAALMAQAARSATRPQPPAADETAQDAPTAPEPVAIPVTVEEEAPAAAPAEADNGLARGDLIEGTIAATTPQEVTVDLGEGRTGFIQNRELEKLSPRQLDAIRVGEPQLVFVVNPRNHEGKTILSITHAQEELDWRQAEAMHASKDVFEGEIGGYNKGGLIVRFGALRGFVPQSQIGETRVRAIQGETPQERYGPFVKQPINVKVMEVDRGRNRLILSERAAMREVRQARKEQLVEALTVGEERDGRVVSLENFGAFVDVGGAEGLIHVTELSWKHISHPKEVVQVGQNVRVRVISVDTEKNRIGLSIKQLLADPWDEIAAAYQPGQLVEGRITKLSKFGAFARVLGEFDVEGLIHISELSDHRVEHPRDVVNRDDVLTLRVIKVDVKDRRLGLSLKRVNSAEYLDSDLERAFHQRSTQSMPQAEPTLTPDAGAEPEPEALVTEDAVADVQEAVAETTAAAGESAAEAEEDTASGATQADEEEVTG
jgi:small subunit ribosomal protein S1